eukprot:2109783-Rhodomonas_salina.5
MPRARERRRREERVESRARERERGGRRGASLRSCATSEREGRRGEGGRGREGGRKREWERERQREREKDRETEKQRDRETVRQRDRATDAQSPRNTNTPHEHDTRSQITTNFFSPQNAAPATTPEEAGCLRTHQCERGQHVQLIRAAKKDVEERKQERVGEPGTQSRVLRRGRDEQQHG